MSWHYLRGQEVASWPGDSLDGAPLALLSLIPSQEASCSHDSETDASNGSRSGMTSGRSPENAGAATSTSLRAGFLAKTFRRLGLALGLKANARDYGQRWRESLARFGPRLCLPKTHRTFALAGLSESSKTLPLWGMAFDGDVWEIATRADRPLAPACGWLPRPTTIGNELSPSMMKWPVHRRLLGWVADSGNDDCSGGALPPALRELLMDWPDGWTALEPLETDRWQAWLHLHGSRSPERTDRTTP